MATELHTKVGAAWKRVETLHTKVGAAWKAVDAGYIKIGSVWKQFYTSVVCTAGTSTIPDINDNQPGGTTARAGARWGSDLNVYTRDGSLGWTDTGNNWNGSCPNTEYEGRWSLNTGDAPSSSAGTNGTWHTMTSDVMVGYDTPADDIIYDGNFTFELRRLSDSVVILTDTFQLTAQEQPT